eukprot:COSAG04_NODE_133_length_23964_cov_7.547999_5_plen_96_part_00
MPRGSASSAGESMDCSVPGALQAPTGCIGPRAIVGRDDPRAIGVDSVLECLECSALGNSAETQLGPQYIYPHTQQQNQRHYRTKLSPQLTDHPEG